MNIHRVRPASAGGGDFRVLFIYPNLMMSALVLLNRRIKSAAVNSAGAAAQAPAGS